MAEYLSHPSIIFVIKSSYEVTAKKKKRDLPGPLSLSLSVLLLVSTGHTHPLLKSSSPPLSTSSQCPSASFYGMVIPIGCCWSGSVGSDYKWERVVADIQESRMGEETWPNTVHGFPSQKRTNRPQTLFVSLSSYLCLSDSLSLFLSFSLSFFVFFSFSPPLFLLCDSFPFHSFSIFSFPLLSFTFA